MSTEINYVDVFSGCGGLSKGFDMAGLKGVCGLEFWPPANLTYKSNFSHPVVEGDICDDKTLATLIKTVGSTKVDVVAGGFPCQGFSMAGLRKRQDPRNKLYKRLLDIVNILDPKIIVMENVKGLLSMLDGKVIERIVKDVQALGYKIDYKVLIAADYGVPQLRERVIFIANRINKDNIFPTPIINKKNYITVAESITNLSNKPENKTLSHIFSKHSPEMVKKISKVAQGDSLYGYSDAFKRVFSNKPSPTVKENHGGVFLHPILNRVMTPRELARLQSFPDNFLFKGTKSAILKQLGNAVPPLMAKAIGLSIRRML